MFFWGFFSSDSLILCIPLATVIITFLTLITVFIFTWIRTLNQKQCTKLDYEHMVMCKIHLFFFRFFTGKKEEESKNKKRAISNGSWENQQGLWCLYFQGRGLLHLFCREDKWSETRVHLAAVLLFRYSSSWGPMPWLPYFDGKIQMSTRHGSKVLQKKK